MSINQELIDQIKTALGNTIMPSITSSDDASDIFEGYLFALVVHAARLEGATITYKDVYGQKANKFVFRTSPGYISSTEKPYTHAVINFPNRPLLEVHIGVRVSGKSQVLHECDIAVIDSEHAEECRNNNLSNPNRKIHPKHTKVILAIECKFYKKSSVTLELARNFMGLVNDITRENRFFVVNKTLKTSDSVAKYFGKKVKMG